MQNSTPKISVVVPGFDEEESIRPLYDEVKQVLDAHGEPWELIFVDDGSRDRTIDAMDAVAAEDSRVIVLKFARNFGKSAAYMAAFAAVRGERVVTMDADLQDDPNEIPKLLTKLESGFDLVVGWKQGRMGNEAHKALPSRVFNRLGTSLFGLTLHDQNCGFRVMKRPVARALDLYGGNYRFIPQLAHVKGFAVTEEGVHHRKRAFGVSKYGASRFWTGFLDVITVRFLTAFAHRPMHFFATVGLLLASPGVLLLLYVLAAKLLGGTFQEHIAALVVGVMLVLLGNQAALTGLLGELSASQRTGPRYILEER